MYVCFDFTKPSPNVYPSFFQAGVSDGEHVVDALEDGLMTENKMKGLLYLIREPDVSPSYT